MFELLAEIVDGDGLVQRPVERDSHSFSYLASRRCYDFRREQVQSAKLVFGTEETPGIARWPIAVEW